MKEYLKLLYVAVGLATGSAMAQASVIDCYVDIQTSGNQQFQFHFPPAAPYWANVDYCVAPGGGWANTYYSYATASGGGILTSGGGRCKLEPVTPGNGAIVDISATVDPVSQCVAPGGVLSLWSRGEVGTNHSEAFIDSSDRGQHRWGDYSGSSVYLAKFTISTSGLYTLYGSASPLNTGVNKSAEVRVELWDWNGTDCVNRFYNATNPTGPISVGTLGPVPPAGPKSYCFVVIAAVSALEQNDLKSGVTSGPSVSWDYELKP